MARPRKEFDWTKLDAILQFGASFLECEDILDVSEATIKRRIKEDFPMREQLEKRFSKTRVHPEYYAHVRVGDLLVPKQSVKAEAGESSGEGLTKDAVRERSGSDSGGSRACRRCGR